MNQNEREKLIEEAAKAIYEDYIRRYPEEPPMYHAGPGQPVWRHMARVALAVFENGHDIAPWSPTGRIDSPVSHETCGRSLFIGHSGDWEHVPQRAATAQDEPSDARDIIVQEVSRLAGMQLLRRYSSFSDTWWDELLAGIARVVRAAEAGGEGR